MSKTILRTLAAALVLSAAACGSDGGPSYSSTVDVATATTSGTDAAYWATGLSESILDFNFSTDIPLGVRGTDSPRYAELLIARLRAQGFERARRPDLAATASPFRVASVCEPVETGVDIEGYPIDSDNDEIPDDYRLDFGSACTDSEGDYAVTYSGSLRIRDLAGLFGYRLDAANFKIRWTHLAEYEQFSLNGFETGAFTASAVTNATDMDYGEAWSYSVTAPDLMLAPGTGSVLWSLVSSATYDPDGTISWGASVPSGTLDFSADYKVRFAGEAGSDGYHFLIASTTPLSVQASPCEGPIAGVVDGELNGDADIGFTVTWNACNSFGVVTRGTSDAAASAVR